VAIAVLAFLLEAGIGFAEPAVPNLVGTWTVKSEGAVLLRGAAPEAKFSSIQLIKGSNL
jgi:hypothetical protein